MGKDQICTRRLRVLKYRGAAHGMNEYPFLIGALQADADAESEEARFTIAQESLQKKTVQQNHDVMSRQRGGRNRSSSLALKAQ